MATKADQIIARFTSDPGLHKEILAIIADIRAKGGIAKVSKQGGYFDQVIKQYTGKGVDARVGGEAGLEALIKEIADKVRKGYDVDGIMSYHELDQNKATEARETAIEHAGAITHIVTSK